MTAAAESVHVHGQCQMPENCQLTKSRRKITKKRKEKKRSGQFCAWFYRKHQPHIDRLSIQMKYAKSSLVFWQFFQWGGKLVADVLFLLEICLSVVVEDFSYRNSSSHQYFGSDFLCGVRVTRGACVCDGASLKLSSDHSNGNNKNNGYPWEEWRWKCKQRWNK